MFFFNIVLAVLTFVAYIFPFLAPKLFPLLSVFTLFLPMILIINLLFFIYWGIQIKRQALLSGIVLLIGITFINKFYKFGTNDYKAQPGDIKIMSYNVRLFNKFEWSEKTTVGVEISDFVRENNPDILCIQEFSKSGEFDKKQFPYNYITFRGQNISIGQAIFSKYKIVNSGDIEFPNSSNRASFADVVRGNDTIRIYNMHLQSIKISPDVQLISEDKEGINEAKSKKMFRRISNAFAQQQQQAEILRDHRKGCHYPFLICGDMNNSAFSYVYRTIKGDLNDTFEEAGEGFGKSYDFKYYPARIDYIFADKRYEVKSFRNFPEIMDSDHFPVIAIIANPEQKS